MCTDVTHGAGVCRIADVAPHTPQSHKGSGVTVSR
jgi:hypothetical protein